MDLARVSTAAVMVALPLLLPGVVSALEPLPAETAAVFRGISPDEPPEKLTQDTHFVVSDELRHDQFRDAVNGLGGVYIGVGTDQNYTMAAWVRPEIMVLLDFDQVVVDLHRVYSIAFTRCDDAACFIQFWAEQNRPEVLKLLKEAYPDLHQYRKVKSAFRMGQKKVHRRLSKLKQVYSWLKVPHFLTHQGQYDYLRDMFNAGRVFMVRGDLTADVTMRQLAGALKKTNMTARVLYISNCEMYFNYNLLYRKNIWRMPIDGKSVILRTRPWREWVRNGKGKMHYLFVLQGYENFSSWLRNRSVKTVKQLVPYRALKKGKLYLEINETLAQRRAKLRELRKAK